MGTQEIRHVGVFSVAKFCAAMSLVFSFMTTIITAIFLYFGIVTVDAAASIDLSAGIASVAFGMALVAISTVIIGFISGAVMAVIYNIAAGIFGGIEIDLD